MRAPNGEWKEVPGLLAASYVVGDHYFAPLTFNAPRRTNDNAPQRAALLWADLDADFNMDRMEEELPPHHLWETSPGSFQALWWTEWADINTILDLNKRLTYWVGADKGGWFASKLLRVPETYNWKRVQHDERGMYVPYGSYHHDVERPEYKIADLQAVLPPRWLGGSRRLLPPVYNGEVSVGSIPEGDPAAAVARHHKLAGRLQQNHVTDRSKRLYTMARWLDKQGVPPEDIYLLLSIQSYNKFSQRPEQLWKMVAEIAS